MYRIALKPIKQNMDLTYCNVYVKEWKFQNYCNVECAYFSIEVYNI